MNTIIKFLLTSSADPQKTSLTVKALLLGTIPTIMYSLDMVCRLGYECVALDASLLEQLINALTSFVFLFLSILSVWGTIYGLGRKVVLTAIGENQALK